MAEPTSGRRRAEPGYPVELLAVDPDSEISALMTRTDWSATPLGPVGQWTAELRTAIGIALNSRFPMMLMWGAELTMIYNDAFTPILGAKHPALGQPAARVWDDAWPVVGERIVGAYKRGAVFYAEDLLVMLRRNGFDEEVYFTFCYSPVPDPSGGIAAVLTVVTETTAHVLGNRRMAALQQLGEIRADRAGTVEQAATATADVLAKCRADLPFGLVYLLDDDGHHARLAASHGMAAEHVPPARLPAEGDAAWMWEAISTGTAVTRTGLAKLTPGLARPGASPVGDAPVDTAVALPLSVAGQGGPSGVLVAATSPYLALDGTYLAFLELVAGQVAGAVTDARAYAAQRRRADQLTELDRAKTEFFTGVSHELRTPLTLIAGPARDSLDDPADPLSPAHRRRMEIIHRNSGRLRRLVDTLLDFAQIESGRLRPEPVAVELGELTRGIAESFAPAARRAGLTLSVDCPSGGQWVLIDPDMWEKIVLNLLSNAVKFTLDGTIDIRLRTGDGSAELQVSDTGVGIPAGELPLLFQRFHRVRGVHGRSQEGSGIGLALVHELTGLLGGHVHAASEIEQGTTFTVRIPTQPADRTPARSPRPSSAGRYIDEALQWSAVPAAAAQVTSPATSDAVLIAEDSPDLREYLTGLLAPNYAVSVAANGEEALKLARHSRPDLVLADVMMPRLDGFGLLHALRADPATAGVPVVFLSARAGEEAAIEGLTAGADDYLVKPFSSAELLARVRSHLDLARLRNHESAWRTALVNAMQDGFFVATADGTVIEVNEAFTTVLGFGTQDLPYSVPHPWWPDAIADPAASAHVIDTLSTALVSGSGRFTLPLRHRDGRRLWVDVAVDALRDRAGDEQLIVGTVRDVTTAHLAAERDAALARLADQLAATDDSDRIRTAGIAEIRALWRADRTSIVYWSTSGEPSAAVTTGVTGPAGSGLPPADAGQDSRAGQIVIRPAGDPTAVTGVGAPITDGADPAMIWLEFPAPRSFTAADQAVLGRQRDHMQRALSRARISEEQRHVALVLQRSILGPTELPAGFAVHYQPAAGTLEVGGDWYDVVDLPDGRYGLVVGDVVGRGLPAATAMGQLRSASRALLLDNAAPAAMLTTLDRFAQLIPDARCTTVFCAIVDPHTGTMHYSSAGHPPAILAAAGGDHRLLDQAQALPLAIATGRTRPEATVTVPAGSTLLLYTDGLIERRDDESLDTGIDRAAAALARPERNPGRVAGHLAATLLGDGHNDDVAFLVYRRQAST